jgi:hypothetical protein
MPFHDITGDQAGTRTANMDRHTAIQVPFEPDAKKAILEDIIAIEISKDVLLFLLSVKNAYSRINITY